MPDPTNPPSPFDRGSLFSNGVEPTFEDTSLSSLPLSFQEEEDPDSNPLIHNPVVRGLAAATEGILEIPTIIPGVDYDIEDNFGLGTSSSIPGSLIESSIQFISGFVPIAGQLSKVGKLGKATKIAKKQAARRTAKAVDAGDDLSKVARVDAKNILLRAASISGKEFKAKDYRRLQWKKAALAGSIADFTVATHDEERLSNLLQHFGADNFIVNSLAANPDDDQFMGRFKNVLEGAGLGLMVDSVARLIRNHFRIKKVVNSETLSDTDKEDLITAIKEDDYETALEGMRQRAKDNQPIDPNSVETDPEDIFDDVDEDIIDTEDFAEDAPDQAKPAETDSPLSRNEDESVGEWRKRLVAHAKQIREKSGVKLGFSLNRGSADNLFKNIRDLEKAIEEENAIKNEAAQASQGDVRDVPELEEGSSEYIAKEAKDLAESIETKYGAGSSKHRGQEVENPEDPTKKRVVWLDDLGKPLEKDHIKALKKLRNLQAKELRTRDAEVFLGIHKPIERLKNLAHFDMMTNLGKTLVRSGTVAQQDIKEILSSVHEAIEGGIPLSEARHRIKGVYNLALLPNDTQQHIIATLAEHQVLTPGTMVDARGNSLGLKLVRRKKGSKEKHWVDAKGRTWSKKRIEEAQRQVFMDVFSMTEGQAKEWMTQFNANQKEYIAKALGDVAESRAKLDVEEQSLISLVQMQLDDFQELFESTMDTAKGAALREKLGLKSVKHANAELQRWQDEGGISMLNAQARGKTQSSYGLLKYRHISARDTLPESAEALLKDLGNTEYSRKMARKILDAREVGGMKAAIATIKQIDRQRRAMAMVNEYFVNVILSGIKTLTTNTIVNLATAVYGPVETLLGFKSKMAWHKLKGTPESAGKKELYDAQMVELKTELIRANAEFFGLWSQMAASSKMAAKTWNPEGTGFWKGFGVESRYHLDEGRGSIDLGDERQAAISGANFAKIRGQEADPDKFGQNALEKIGMAVRVPSKILMTTDEFFKQWNYRTVAQSDLIVRAHQLQSEDKLLIEGKKVSMDDWVDHELTNMTNQGQAIIKENLWRQADQMEDFRLRDADGNLNPRYNDIHGLRKVQEDKRQWVENQLEGPLVDRGAIADRAIAISRERTFTTDLDPDGGVLSSMGAGLTRWSGKHPWFRLITPFIRTPLNILIYAGRRTPMMRPQDLAGVGQYLYGVKFKNQGIEDMKLQFAKELASDDPREAIDAVSRFQASMAFITGVSVAASNGVVTGAGPKDKDLRKVMTDNGWQPYSIKVGDTYMSYQKLDPFATVIGLYADMFDAYKWTTEEDQSELEKLMMATAISLTHNVKAKSYLQGLVNASGFIDDPETSGSAVLGRYAGAFAVPSFVSGFREIADDNYTEMRSILDGVWSRVPGWGTATLDPMRNILGEKMNKRNFSGAAEVVADINALIWPVAVNQTSSNAVTRELATLEYAFSNPPRRRWGTDLTTIKNEKGQSAYDRWLELVGEVKLYRAKRTVQQSLERLIKSKRYQNLDKEGYRERDVDSPAVNEIQKVLRKYRAYALKEMLREFPQLTQIAKEKTVANMALRRGVSSEMIRSQLFPVE